MPNADNPIDGAATAPKTSILKKLKPLWTLPDRPTPVQPRRVLRRPRRKRAHRPVPLRFTPTAWSKLLLMRDAGPTEIGGFGITASDDLLLVHDLRLVRQTCTSVSVAFDDRAVADMFDEQVDLGRRPEQFARIWIHTHPGSSAVPSALDEATFQDVFGRCDWAVMFILARGGATYARLQFRGYCRSGSTGSDRLLELTNGPGRANTTGACDRSTSRPVCLCTTIRWRCRGTPSIRN